jgi:hypothetical protein
MSISGIGAEAGFGATAAIVTWPSLAGGGMLETVSVALAGACCAAGACCGTSHDVLIRSEIYPPTTLATMSVRRTPPTLTTETIPAHFQR